MILVLIPFWTSMLVRVAAWIVLLQTEGLVNTGADRRGPASTIRSRCCSTAPACYIAMTHILLPFMILPLYSVMKCVPPTYLRAAVSLGSHPFAAFWRVYVPQTYPGIGAGALLVFILAIGYYITPALLGGPNDQMVSYYIALLHQRDDQLGHGVRARRAAARRDARAVCGVRPLHALER